MSLRSLAAVPVALLLAVTAVQAPAAAAPKHADVALTLAVDSTIRPGTPFTLQIGLVNNGPATATGVAGSVHLPAGLTVQSGLTCEATPDGGSSCPVGPTDIPAGQAAMGLALVVAASPGTYTISGTVSAQQRDRVRDNNTAAVTFVVAPATDVALEPIPDQTVTVGAGFGFSLGVRNNGPGEATNVVATVRLPAGLTVVLGPCVPDAAGGNVCTIGASSLPAGAGVASPVLLTASTPGAYPVTGTATADQPDPVPANNTDAATVTVVG